MKKEETSIQTISKDPAIYEVGFHIVPTVNEGSLGERVTAIRDVILANGGTIIADEYPKHIELAYSMTKVVSNKRALYSSAYFGWLKFEVEPKGAKAINDQLKSDDFIIRYLLVKTVRENTMAPKKVFAKRTEETARPEEKVEEKPAMTEEELDKTIEDLVIA